MLVSEHTSGQHTLSKDIYLGSALSTLVVSVQQEEKSGFR